MALRLRSGLVAGALAASLGLVPAGTSPATAAVPTPVLAAARAAIGGPELASRGVVVHPAAGVPPAPRVSAAGWLVADLDSGQVLAARNAHGRFLPASTQKVLTALVLLPRLPPNRVVVAQPADAAIEGSKVGLVPGTGYTVDTLMRSLLVVSGNDAANSLATAGGGQRRVVALMNAEARRLGAADTVAGNPSGLDAPGQATSPYDLALFARAGLEREDFTRYVGTLRSHVNAPRGRRYAIYNHNKLLTRYSGAFGIKTGFTVAARHTFVGAARRGGRRLVVTLLRTNSMYPDAEALLDWGFRAAGRVTPVGRLVPPVDTDLARAPDAPAPAPAPPPAPADAPAVAAAPSTPARPARRSSPYDVVAAAAGGFLVALVTGGHWRRRRRRGWR